MIKLYGTVNSRAFRPMWLMQEIDLQYELISTDFRKGETHSDAYLKINPNGKAPTLVDGELVLYESMAINLYLAKQYGGDFYPTSLAQEALTNMWSYWVITEVEYSLLSVLMNTRILPREKRDSDKAKRNLKALEAPFTVLNTALSGKEYLVRNKFSVADLNVSAVLSWCRPAKIHLGQWPHIHNWLERCISRPAFKQVMKK